MSGSEASYNDADASAQELADSLRKMGKIVNNLMARADCVPFREPVDWKGLGVSLFMRLVVYFCSACSHVFVFAFFSQKILHFHFPHSLYYDYVSAV